MAKRFKWQNNGVIVLKLSNDKFTVAQMLFDHQMLFFDIISDTEHISGIDLNKTPFLFKAITASTLIGRHMYVKTVSSEDIKPVKQWEDYFWIISYKKGDRNYKGGINGPVSYGGKLVEITPDDKSAGTAMPPIKECLSIPEDRAIIEKYELTNMWSHEDLNDRLVRYFETGINRDDLKFEVFSELWDDREKLRPLTRRMPEPWR